LYVYKFYIRRVLRLYPPLIICLFISYSMYFVGVLSGGFSWGGFFSQVFYLHNYAAIYFPADVVVPSGTGVLWSLAVEEHFYLFMPVIFLIFGSPKTQRWIGRVFLLLAVVAICWRIVLTLNDVSFERIYYATDTRFDSILYGAILAIYCNPVSAEGFELNVRSFVAPVIFGLLLLISALFVRDVFFRNTFRYSFIGLGLMPLFYMSIRFAFHPCVRWLEMPWLKRVGVWSYSIYLSHYFLMLAFSGFTGFAFLDNCLGIAVSVLIAAGIERYVDRPFSNLRARYR